MTKDAIFLMLTQTTQILTESNPPNFIIIEYVEENETRNWNYVATFGNKLNGYDKLLLPEVIKPMENGKFIFFPKETKIRQFLWSFDAIELWEKNTALTRSPLELPINITSETRSFWILQV